MRVTLLGLICTLASPLGAQEIAILPADIVLSGPKANQWVIVVEKRGATVIGQVDAKLSLSDAKIATLDNDTLHAVSDGETTLTATFGVKTATAKVRVQKAGEPFAWSFRNHVIPVMTRLGCNSGACHGALAG